ncbi:polyprenyl synthetase family protein [bacterium]|nr:MAG: polyprenyl synthetase family protein [bacterium]
MIEEQHADLHAMVEGFFSHRFSTDNALITEAVSRMLRAGGKRIRPRFTLLGAQVSGGDAESQLPLAAYMELIHVATLIHDDVVDEAQTRRGVNATAVDFGNRVSVLAGDYLFAWIFRNVTKHYPHPIPMILAQTLADITDGEVLQLRSLGDLETTMDSYRETVGKKTAALFAASAEVGAIVGGGAPETVQAVKAFAYHYGIAFQMLDDLLDVTATESDLGKPVANDLRERKITLPLLVALRLGGRKLRGEVERYFSDGQDPRAAHHVIDAMSACGAFEATHETIAEEVQRALDCLAPLAETPAKASFAAFAKALTLHR